MTQELGLLQVAANQQFSDDATIYITIGELRAALRALGDGASTPDVVVFTDADDEPVAAAAYSMEGARALIFGEERRDSATTEGAVREAAKAFVTAYEQESRWGEDAEFPTLEYRMLRRALLADVPDETWVRATAKGTAIDVDEWGRPLYVRAASGTGAGEDTPR